MVKKGAIVGRARRRRPRFTEKRIPEISDLRDESDIAGLRLVIELSATRFRRSC